MTHDEKTMPVEEYLKDMLGVDPKFFQAQTGGAPVRDTWVYSPRLLEDELWARIKSSYTTGRTKGYMDTPEDWAEALANEELIHEYNSRVGLDSETLPTTLPPGLYKDYVNGILVADSTKPISWLDVDTMAIALAGETAESAVEAVQKHLAERLKDGGCVVFRGKPTTQVMSFCFLKKTAVFIRYTCAFIQEK